MTSTAHRRRRHVRAAVALIFTTAVVLIATGGPAAARSGGRPSALGHQVQAPTLLRQSDWSTVSEPFVIEFSLPGLQASDTLRAKLYQPVGSGAEDRWSDLVSQRTTGDLGDRLGDSLDAAPESIAADGTATITLPPSFFLDQPGVYPLVVEVRRGGSPIASLQTWAVRVQASNATPMRVMFVAVHRSVPLTQSDGRMAATPAQRSELQALVGLQQAAVAKSLVSTVYPETLVGLTESANPEDRALGADLIAALSATDNLRTGYTNLHLGLWAANATNPDLTISYATANSEFERLVGQPTGVAVAPPDPSLTPQAVAALEASGAQLFLVDPTIAKVPATAVRPARRLVHIQTGSTTPAKALIVDSQLTSDLAAVTDSASRYALQAELAATALDGLEDGADAEGEAAVVVVPSTTDPEQFSALTTSLSADNELVTIAHPDDLLSAIRTAAPSPGQPDATAELTLDNTPPAIMGELPVETRRLRQRLNAERMTFQNQDPFGPAADARLLAAITLGVTPEYQATALSSIDRETTEHLGALRLVKQSTITVTSRTAALPIQIRNDTQFDARVRVRFRSDRIALDSGEDWLEVTVRPGTTTVDADVTMRSSGVFPIQTELQTVDGSVVTDVQEITVRSTAFSGVGLIVGGVSLACLLLWWFKTILRDRRGKRRDVSPAPDNADNLT